VRLYTVGLSGSLRSAEKSSVEQTASDENRAMKQNRAKRQQKMSTADQTIPK